MNRRFNTYIDFIEADFWKKLCLEEGEMRRYEKGEEFVSAGKVARYIGYIVSGTLKYIIYSDDGAEHVIGFEFADGFVADFPFSLHRQPAKSSIVASSCCEILCVPTSRVAEIMDCDPEVKDIVMRSTNAIFSTVYDRYKALYNQSPQQRYNELITRHPDLFASFSLKDIASYLNVTPTHLSRLRKKL